MIIKDNMANMCAKVTSTYMEFTLAFGPKPEFSFSFKLHNKTILSLTHFLPKSNHMFYDLIVFNGNLMGRNLFLP